ncbi:MAG TPA: gephyrin-like molybdotransferase Glp [Chitinophagaceae bacterium]|nr:gephyrin-like molybdotransferase Glp [Chitinophagaceae bacterium]
MSDERIKKILNTPLGDGGMISVEEAKKIIGENVVALEPAILSLLQAAGKILAEDIYSTIDIPAFPQSSMDGYAFLFSEWKKNKKLAIEGEIAAGNNKKLSLAPGKAVRIFTGAPVPSGADTVVMQEKVEIHYSKANSSAGSEGDLIIKDELIQMGANVRPTGSEIKAGEMILRKGSLLSPAAIGFLAGCGIPEVKVFPNPSVSIIITGKELQQPGQHLDHGQVYESNSFTITSALHHIDIDDIRIYHADDNLAIITGTLKKALEESNLVLLAGGISAGDYDFVLEAATNCSVNKLFHKIKQRPGKPLYFGKKENKLVFGLPGNPSSVLTCFYEYVLLALEILTNRKLRLQKIKAPLSKPFRKTALLTHFLKGFYDGKTATVLDAQESYRLSSFAKANCFVKIDEEVMECKEGETVEIHLLPISF